MSTTTLPSSWSCGGCSAGRLEVDRQFVAAPEALEVARDDLLDALEVRTRVRGRGDDELVLARAELGVPVGERDDRLAVVEAHVELVAEGLGGVGGGGGRAARG